MVRVAYSDFHAVLNSANIPPAEVQAALTDAQAILKASGISPAAAQKVVADLQAIAAEAKKPSSTRTKK